jgi:hypothetical protein
MNRLAIAQMLMPTYRNPMMKRPVSIPHPSLVQEADVATGRFYPRYPGFWRLGGCLKNRFTIAPMLRAR